MSLPLHRIRPAGRFVRTLFSSFFLILLLPVWAGPANAAEIKPKRVSIENGMTLLILERPSLPVVSVEVLVQAGALFDPDEKAGLANLTASLLDEGTKKRKSTDISDAVDFIGASLSASANDDYASASLKVLKKDVETGLELLSDILINPVFDPKEVERVRNNILGGILAEKDQPQVIAERAFQKDVFGNHPYRNPVSGREDSVPKISRDDLVSFHQKFYRPNNTILAVVGDVTEKEAVALVRKYFGEWEKNPVPLPQVGPPQRLQAKRVEVIHKDLTQASVMLGHVGIERSNPDYYAVTVMNYILGGGGFSSRMMTDIRDNRGLVYSIYSRFDAGKLPGAFSVSLQTKTESAGEAIEGVLQEIKKMKGEPVSETELSEAKSYLVGSFPLRIDTTGKLASLLSAVEFYQLGLDYFEKYPEYINKVTREEISRVARKYLDPEHYVLVVVANRSEVDLDRKTEGAAGQKGSK